MRVTLFVAAALILVPLVTPAGAPTADAVDPVPVSFVADDAAAHHNTSPWVTVPSTVEPGDRLVLFLSLNAADRSVSSPTGPEDWSPHGDRVARTMRTLVWSTVASEGDAGSRVTIPLSSRTKSTVHVEAYRGVETGPLTVASSVHTNTSNMRTTPQAAVPEGAWAVSYWASKSPSTTSWTPPPQVTARSSAVNSGSGRIASLLADSGRAVPAGTYGGLTATSDASSSAATTWTVVLPAAAQGSNQEPQAAFTHSCSGLSCTFDATTSSDAEGPIASYDWDFGDGTGGSGATVQHTYPTAGVRAVTLTVTDAEGATDAVAHSVTTSGPDPGVVTEVPAEVETDPVSATGDAADDPAIWVHPTVPAQSLVIGNDKQGALEVYDLDGTRRQRITNPATSFWGNVDVRQDVTIGARTLDVVVAYNAGLRTFDVDPTSRLLAPVGDGTGAIPTNGGEGLCAYNSAVTDQLHVFVITRPGRVRQYRIHDADGDGLLEGALVREFFVGSESEGCFADDTTGRLYVAEEDVGLWRYGAEPGSGSARTLVDAVAPQGNLAYDVEGVTLVDTGEVSGYLVVSAQNGAQPSRSFFAVYDRQTNAYLWSFRISGSARADGCERTDGIAAHAGNLGPAFPTGVFVCQDNGNTSPAPGNQNFKLTGLDAILPGA